MVNSTKTQAFMTFLKSRNTGLKQKSADWVAARQSVIGASEISALTRSSPFESPESLLQKKIQPTSMHNNTACTWGKIFEPVLRKYFEQKHSVSVFGHSINLNLPRDHPLYGKVTCSPDGYYFNKNNELILLEFKCPFKRKIAVSKIPSYYIDQIQTGLASSGESVNKGLFVDAFFRMCSLKQLEPSLIHNQDLNGGNKYKTKTNSVLAWGICYLFSKQKIYKNQKAIIDLGSPKTSTALFNKKMVSISEKDVWCRYNKTHMSFTKKDEDEEFLRLKRMEKAFNDNNSESIKPVACFGYKLLDIIEIQVTKQHNFLENMQESIECFHKNLSSLKQRVSDLTYGCPIDPVEVTAGDDSEFVEQFLRRQHTRSF